MRFVFITSLMLLSFAASAQFNKHKTDTVKASRDTVIVPNKFQLADLQQREQAMQAAQEQYQYQLMLILGMRKEEIESLKFDNGKFIVTIKARNDAKIKR